jgi:hypothetical protein
MDSRLKLGAYQRSRQQFEGVGDDSHSAMELHNRRKVALNTAVLIIVNFYLTKRRRPTTIFEFSASARSTTPTDLHIHQKNCIWHAG